MPHPPLASIRNIGIISHIDAGKTTVSERILFYSGETHKMGEVHEGLAVMDWMPQEQERGITITATATSCRWGEWWLNLIDTPGHIDFTIEVERSLRALDGAVAIFSAVEGVQPQSESVWHQAGRYRVPRVCFINKMDRVGADYRMVLDQMAQRLGARPLLLQLPVGSESAFAGVIDLLSMTRLTFDEHDQGRLVERGAIPAELSEEARLARERLVEAVADFDDAILADFLAGGEVSTERLVAAIRVATLSCRAFPVLLGAALRNKGVQPLLDAIGAYLPSPLDVPPLAGRRPDGTTEMIACDPAAPLCALAFKVQSDEGRKLTYLRLYAGEVREGGTIFNSRKGGEEKVARLFRMHAHKRERLESARAGDVVAVTGLKDALTGDAICAPEHPIALEGLVVPEPVVSVAVEPKGAEDRERLPLALEKLQWEDPTFRVREDAETGQTILTGMGELHLEIVADRLAREFGVRVSTGRPQVVYRETLRREISHREVFRREAEGKVQGGELLLRLVPLSRGEGVRVALPPAEGSPVPAQWFVSLEESLRFACAGGCASGYPLTDLEVRVEEIPFEPGITTEQGIRAAAQRGVVMAARQGGPLLLEPVMALEVIFPADCSGKVLGSLQQKRGRVEGVESHGETEVVRATAPLAALFGFMTELRSATRGRGTFTMEFARYEAAPADIQKRFGL